MSRITNQRYLRQEQYKTSANLEARIALHRRFGTTHSNWFRWVFERIAPQPGDQILELGCGPGDLWRESAGLHPEDLTIILGDLSPGMLHQARTHLPSEVSARFIVTDAQAIPLADASLDIVIANHMLYHVPNIPLALEEILRVLKPGGRFLAATNGTAHMAQLDDLICRHAPEFGGLGEGARRFSLENAVDILTPYFSGARLEIFVNDLKVTEAQPLADYISSSWNLVQTSANSRLMEEILAEVRAEIDEKGYFFIGKSQGIIMAIKPADATSGDYSKPAG